MHLWVWRASVGLVDSSDMLLLGRGGNGSGRFQTYDVIAQASAQNAIDWPAQSSTRFATSLHIAAAAGNIVMVQELRLACIHVCTCWSVCRCCKHTFGSRHLRTYERFAGVVVQTCLLGAVVQTCLVSRAHVLRLWEQECHITHVRARNYICWYLCCEVWLCVVLFMVVLWLSVSDDR